MEEIKMETLIEGLQRQMNRVREIIKVYETLPKNAGLFAATMMEQSIEFTEAQIAKGDTIEMIACYKDLEEYEL